MQRTFNYTGRKRIEQKQALFSCTEENGSVREFDVELSIDPTEYPQDASIYIEAHFKETRQRFDFGTVTKVTKPLERKLNEVAGVPLFRVLIVDESGKHGRLLAIGEQFRADTDDKDDNKSSILSVVARPLGQLTWKVEFETGGPPELWLNNSIPNAIEKVRTNPTFQALILPAALREVLIYYAWNEADDEGDEYCERRMLFASLFGEEKPESNDPIDLLRWVEEVVSGFSDAHHLTDMFVNTERGGDE